MTAMMAEKTNASNMVATPISMAHSTGRYAALGYEPNDHPACEVPGNAVEKAWSYETQTRALNSAS